MVRIDAVTINKLGNVAGPTTLRFGPRGVVLLGRNGTGKTTLLNLLVALLRGDWDSVHDADYDVAFQLTCTDGTQVSVSLETTANQVRDFDIKNEQSYLYSSITPKQRHHLTHIQLRSAHDSKVTRISSVEGKSEYQFSDNKNSEEPFSTKDGWLLLLPAALHYGISSTWFNELFWLAHHVARFDEGLNYFDLLTEEREDGLRIAASRKPFPLRATGTILGGTNARSNDRFAFDMSSSRFVGPRLATLFINAFTTTHDSASPVHADADQVTYLRTFCNLAAFHDASITANFDERLKDEIVERVTFTPVRYTVSNGRTVMNHRYLSFGEKRLLAFLHYLDSGDGPLVADELVNGMHYDWITACLQMLETRQAFLSSQNPLLFDFLEFDSVEDVASRFVICKHDDKRGFLWSNMSDDDAQELYETYKTGIQHVGEILRTRGYW
jgi:energy-coupling factor transporter ATP-binding protein EcfA2